MSNNDDDDRERREREERERHEDWQRQGGGTIASNPNSPIPGNPSNPFGQ